MTGNVKAQTIIVKATNIHLIQDLLVLIIEKFNHGTIETVGTNNKLIFSFWSSEKEYREMNQSLINSNFDIEIENVIMFREVQE